MTAEVIPFRKGRPRGGVIVIGPNPFIRGWFLISQCIGGKCYPLGGANNFGMALYAGERLAKRFGAQFCPVGRPTGGAA